MDELTQVSAAGILAVLIIKMVLDYLEKKEARGKPDVGACNFDGETKEKVHTQYGWHDHNEHDPGAGPDEKVWWNTALKRDMRCLSDSVETLATNVGGQTKALEGLTTTIKEMKE